jgi:hypothetical protein
MKILNYIPTICLVASSLWVSAKQPPAVREIMDASTGMHWVLVKNAEHPGGPGRMAADFSPRVQRVVVIRAGDAIVVEEHSDRVDARLEAVALAPAAAGEAFAVRLHIGGKVIRARAISPGRAELASEGGWR